MSIQTPRGPLHLVRVTRKERQILSILAGKIMAALGPTGSKPHVEPGLMGYTMNFRKPLRVDEVNRMTETPDVKAREGRP